MTVPKLRFPEFRDAGEWEEKELGQLGKLVSGLTYSPDDVRDKGLLVLRSSNIQNGMITLGDNVFVRTDIKGVNLSSPNDILICVRNGSKSLIGKNALIPEGMPPCTHGAFMTVFRSDYFKFIFHLFQTEKYEKQVSADLGATINSINGNHLKKYKFYIPIFEEEQQTIADCLASLDDRLAAETQTLETLKAHKKGLMQQLFPAEGETLPKLRFPEFRDAGEWNSDAFDDLLEIIDGDRGTNYPKSDEFSSSGYCIFLNAKNVTKNGFKFDEIQFITKEKDKVLRKGKLQRLDVVLTTRGSVGQFAIYTEDVLYDNIRINSGMVILRIKTIKINADYLYAFCKSQALATYIDNIAFGNAQQQLTVAEIKKFQLFYPTLPEQQTIADCLTSLDETIAAQAKTIALLKLHKKGLMQQLFPAVEEAKR